LAYLRKHGVIPQTVRFETDCPGLRPGQLLPVDIPAAGLGDNYLVESVNMRDLQGRINRYRVSAVSGDALGGWLEWFSALARQAQKFVLYDEDQVIDAEESRRRRSVVSDISATSIRLGHG
jgi:hypothetical protein